MWLDEVFDRFAEKSPFSVMTRATLEHLFADSFLDQVFEENAQVQYEKALAFSTVASLLTQVVLRYRPSVRNAYQRREDVPATLKSVYLKLQGVEPAVCEALVHQTSLRAEQVLACFPNAARPDPVPGLRLRTFDGNYLAGTEHRLAALRGDGAAALPGMSVVMRDDRTGLLQRLVCREDAYTNERALLEDLLGWVAGNDLIVADRNFCWFDFLRGVAAKMGFFVIRHHEQVGLTEVSKLRYAGRSDTGKVYEQEVKVGPEGMRLRCIVVRLFVPTQDGDTEVRLLSNVPKDKAGAVTLAEVYLRRWMIEHTFQDMTELLKCEVNTLGYPKAALFGFCLAVCAYNLLAVMKGALAEVHGREKVEEEFSTYAMAQEISQDTSGLNIAIPAEFWQRFGRMSGADLAEWLKSIAERVPWKPYKKSKRAPKKPPPPKTKGGRRRPHVSTARVLDRQNK